MGELLLLSIFSLIFYGAGIKIGLMWHSLKKKDSFFPDTRVDRKPKPLSHQKFVSLVQRTGYRGRYNRH